MAETKNDKMLERPYCGAMNLTKEPDVDKKTGVRLYRSSPGKVELQIRSIGNTGMNRRGADRHIVSTAEMDVQSAKQLIVWLQRFVEGGDF